MVLRAGFPAVRQLLSTGAQLVRTQPLQLLTLAKQNSQMRAKELVTRTRQKIAIESANINRTMRRVMHRINENHRARLVCQPHAAGNRARVARRRHQRRGRAGRTEPGVCYRLWEEPRPGRLKPTHGRKFYPLTFRPSCSIWRSGEAAIRQRYRSSIPRRRPRSVRQKRCSPSLAPSTARAALPKRARTCAGFRCRRGLPAWWSKVASKAPAKGPLRLPRCSPNAALAATIPTCATGSTSSAATAQGARRRQGRWCSGGTASPLLSLPPPLWGRSGREAVREGGR